MYGESTISYKANEQEGYHGILQGNGAGPCIWVMLSTPLLDHLRHEGHGIPTTTGDGQFRRVPAIGFVDDVDLTETLTDLLQPQERPQASLNTWNTDLRTIAGALQGLKCVWQKLGFKFTSGNRWQIQKIDQLDLDLTFETETGPATLKRMEHNRATLALGIIFSVDGSMDDEVKYLKAKVVKWCDNLQRSNLDRHETWYSVHSGIMRSLNYPLLATTMTVKQITSIMAPLFNIALPKMGICRKMTRDAIYCQTAHKGFGFQDLWVQQGILKLIEVLGRDHTTDTSLLLHESINMCQLESGLGPNFLSHKLSSKFEKLITNGFVKTLWKFCDKHDIKLSCNKRDRIHTHSDCYLMQEWQHLVTDTPTLQDIQACRLHLQVETLSDVINLDGRSFREGVWQGTKQEHDPKWPNQPRPSTKAWNSWRQWLAELVTCNTQGIFTHPYNIQYFDYHQWRWFTDVELHTIYHLQPMGNYAKYQITEQPQRRHTARHYFFTGITCNELPHRCYPAHIIQENNYRIQLDTYSRAISSTFSTITTPVWQDYITKHTTGNTQLLQRTAFTADDPLLLVCDGSFKNGYGSAAYIITTEKLYQQCSFNGITRTTGGPSNQDSYRSELTGILAGLLHINELVDTGFIQQQEINVTVVCDNHEAIKVSLDYILHPSISAQYNHYDIIHSIRSLQRPDILIKYQHVLGHQDDKSTDLDVFAQLNVLMDTNCKAKRERMESEGHPISWIAQLPNWTWRAEMNDTILCNRIEKYITHHISYLKMGKYMISKNKIPNQISYNNIDWNNIAKATAGIKQGQRRWIAKHHVGMCGVNKWRYIWNDRDTDACPRCGQSEDAQHVYLCPHAHVRSIWDDELVNIKIWLDDLNTDPDLTKAIISCLKTLHYGATTPHSNINIQSLQQNIGYINFFEGEIHKEWAIEQQEYWIRHDITLSGNTWARKIITYLWDMRKRFWVARNDIEHAKDAEIYLQDLNTQIAAEIAEGFDSLHPKYNNHINPEALQKLQDSHDVEYKRSWLRNIKAGRTQRAPRNEPAHRLDRTQRLITSYFPPSSN